MAVALALGACLSSFAAEPPKPLKATLGEELKIKLECDSGSDCQWLLAKPLDPKFLKQLGKGIERTRTKSGESICHEVLSFKPLSEGKTEIRFKYDRLWAKNASPVRATNIVVVITAPGSK
jgi:predicted secreted protein